MEALVEIGQSVDWLQIAGGNITDVEIVCLHDDPELSCVLPGSTGTSSLGLWGAFEEHEEAENRPR